MYLINATGTHELGGDTFAHLVWDAAKDSPSMDVVRPISRVEIRLGPLAG